MSVIFAMRSLLAKFALLAIPCLLVLACGDDPVAPNRAQIKIAPDSISLTVGDTAHLTSQVTMPTGAVLTYAVTWTSSDTTVATVSQAGDVVARKVGAVLVLASAAGSVDTAKVVVRAVNDCAGKGTTHSGTIGNETWRRSGSPHVVFDSLIVIGAVNIEAGSNVCMGPGSIIVLNSANPFTALGTAGQHITFRPLDGISAWRGIVVGASSGSLDAKATISYADIFHGTEIRVQTVLAGTTVENSTLHKTSIFSFSRTPNVIIRQTVLDSGSISLTSGTLEGFTIRYGSLLLTRVQTGSINLNGGRIENSPGTAFTVSTLTSGPPSVNVNKSLRIIGSKGNPVAIPIDLFMRLWPTRADQDSLLGNPNDTLEIWQGSTSLPSYIRRELPWRVTCGQISNCSVGGPTTLNGLTIEAGGSLTSHVNLMVDGDLNAVGTAALPVSITGLGSLAVQGTGKSVLSNAIVKGVSITSRDQNELSVRNVDTDAFIALRSSRSSMRNSSIHDFPSLGTTPSVTAALTIAADDVVVDSVTIVNAHGTSLAVFGVVTPVAGLVVAGSNAVIRNCEITDNASDGIRVSSGGNIHINDCNIERNGGYGVINSATNVVDAERNWWGDASGPQGPNGDGVSGNVDYEPFLVARRTRLVAPRVISASLAKAAVGTADTVRVNATLRDNGGRVLGAEPFIVRSADECIDSRICTRGNRRDNVGRIYNRPPDLWRNQPDMAMERAELVEMDCAGGWPADRSGRWTRRSHRHVLPNSLPFERPHVDQAVRCAARAIQRRAINVGTFGNRHFY